MTEDRDALVKRLLEEAHYWVYGVEPVSQDMQLVRAVRDAKAAAYIDCAGIAVENTGPLPELPVLLDAALADRTRPVSRDAFVASLTKYLRARGDDA